MAPKLFSLNAFALPHILARAMQLGTPEAWDACWCSLGVTVRSAGWSARELKSLTALGHTAGTVDGWSSRAN